jgi:TPR repeat protein
MYEQGVAVARDRAASGRVTVDAIETYYARCTWSTETWCQNLWFAVSREVPGVAEDVVEAEALYSRGCDAGDPASCAGLGFALGFRYRVTASDPARALLDGACTAGIAAACRDLAAMIRPETLLADTTNPDLQRVAALFLTACQGGDAGGCTGLGDRMRDGRGPNGYDLVGAATYLQRGCDGGDVVGCRGLADLFRDGIGVARHDPTAAVLYERACAAREMVACVRLAELIGQRRVANPDFARASELFRRACDSGVLDACPTP